jgi:hypothetical protein
VGEVHVIAGIGKKQVDERIEGGLVVEEPDLEQDLRLGQRVYREARKRSSMVNAAS